MKYHDVSDLLSRTGRARPDWATAEGIVAGLKDDLELNGYGSMFQLYRGDMPLPLEDARMAVIDAVAGDAEYRKALRRMQAESPRMDWQPFAENGPEGLMFEHGDFESRIDLAGDIRVTGPASGRRRTKRQEQAEERARLLDQKRRDTEDTPEDDYLAHANQCGYLLRNARLYFLKSKRMRATSVKMKIYDLTMEQLRRFTDSAGRHSLAELSTHRDTRYGSDAAGSFIYSGWKAFSREVVGFLNLDDAIDVDALAAQYHDLIVDTGFLTLDRWGGDADAVAGRLIDRRPDIDADMIRSFFEEGLGGTLTDDLTGGAAS